MLCDFFSLGSQKIMGKRKCYESLEPQSMNRHKITTSRRVGEVSSKYGYQPELFERDLEQHAAESETLWRDFRAWMIERKVDPEKLRYLFLRLWEEFLK